MHTQRYHSHHMATGYGHVYQGRFKSFPSQDDDQFHAVCRYVERNSLTAGIVDLAENCRWGSLCNWLDDDSPIVLSAWPIRRLPRWVDRVNEALIEMKLTAIHHCVARGKPFGDEVWSAATAKRLGLESTARPRGRPKKNV